MCGIYCVFFSLFLGVGGEDEVGRMGPALWRLSRKLNMYYPALDIGEQHVHVVDVFSFRSRFGGHESSSYLQFSLTVDYSDVVAYALARNVIQGGVIHSPLTSE